MKKLFFIICSLVFISAILVISSCSKQEFENDLATDVDKLSQASSRDKRDKNDSVYEVEYILDYIKSNKPIDWTKERDAKLLHSIGFYTDFSYIIGYKPKGFTDFENSFNLNEISKSSWKDAREKILNEFDFNGDDVLQDDGGDLLPAILVEISSSETMERLVGMDELYAIEPQLEIFLLKFDEELQSEIRIVSGDENNSGCGCDQPNEPNVNDFTEIQPGMKMSWNYRFSGITEYAIDEQPDPNVTHAWQISTGQGIGVAVIDSGVSYEQENLDNLGEFDMVGSSFGRYEERRDFLGVELGTQTVGIGQGGAMLDAIIEQPIQDITRAAHDRCGHGTRMAGIIAGPRGVDGNSVGIAYNCNLYNYRAVHNPVIITNREKLAVGRALTAAAMEENIKIINMSIGQISSTLPFTENSPFIVVGIELASDANKMIVCAAGTSGTFTNSIVFPASSDKTIAITGIKIPANYPNDGELEACTGCHAGDGVNYSIIFEDRDNPNRGTLAVTCEDDIPAFSGGTSTAAATFSGIAALVWSKLMSEASPGDPPILPSDVLAKISSSANNPLGITKFGEGYINTLEALEN